MKAEEYGGDWISPLLAQMSTREFSKAERGQLINYTNNCVRIYKKENVSKEGLRELRPKLVRSALTVLFPGALKKQQQESNKHNKENSGKVNQQMSKNPTNSVPRSKNSARTPAKFTSENTNKTQATNRNYSTSESTRKTDASDYSVPKSPQERLPSFARALMKFTNENENPLANANKPQANNQEYSTLETYCSDDEWGLVDNMKNTCRISDEYDRKRDHELTNSPLIARQIIEAFPHLFPQYGFLGCDMNAKLLDQRIYLNTNTPISAFICGVQGSGKSHTVSTILESCLISDRRIGRLDAPLTALICHIDPSGGAAGSALPCEFSAISLPRGQRATVFVSPSNYEPMLKLYQRHQSHVQVRPLFLSIKDLNIDRMLTLMAIDEGDTTPLYMRVVQKLLRDIGEPFDYNQFRSLLEQQEFSSQQRIHLDMRMDLLESFLVEQISKTIPGYSENAPKSAATFKQFFGVGDMVIVDLTDPFIDGSFASALFDIVVGMFVEVDSVPGKVLVFDEAHKYITKSDASQRLVQHLLRLIRQQRHLGLRTMISTQDPTSIPHALLDLCSVAIVYRFSSPSWWQHLKKHLGSGEALGIDWFEQVVQLQTGEAMIFSPGSVYLDEADSDSVRKFGTKYIRALIRQRVTKRSGESRLAVSRV